MKAATIVRYGSPGVIEVRDVPAPVPGPDEVLVRVHAATVNRTDCGELLHPAFTRLLTGGGLPRRTILGMDFAGTVEAVGASTSLFKPRDRIFGMCGFRFRPARLARQTGDAAPPTGEALHPDRPMKPSVMLTVASLLSLVLIMFHLTDDVLLQAEGAVKYPIPVIAFIADFRA